MTIAEMRAILGLDSSVSDAAVVEAYAASLAPPSSPTSNDLAQLADLKSYLGQTTTADDTELQRQLTAYSQFVRSFTNRDFTLQSYDLTRSGKGSAALFLPQYPIQSVQLLAIDGREIAAQTGFSSAGYRFDERMIALDGALFTRGFANIRIQFTAGYAVVPFDIQQAALEVIGLRFKERDRIGYVSKGLASESVTFSVKDMPASVRTLLNQYTNTVPC